MKLILGRIIPGQTETPEGRPIYGAHSRIDAMRSDGSDWRISRMEYLEGEITASAA